MTGKTVRLIVDIDAAGERIDRFLSGKLPSLSRSAVQKLLQNGSVCCNGKPVAKNYQVREDDDIAFVLVQETEKSPMPEPIPLMIVYEDDDLLVVNKPRGMVVHPAAGNATGTLVNALLFHCGEHLSDLGGSDRPGILHRIDKDTSGLLVVAKNNEAHARLAEQIKAHSMTREYRAVVHGVVKQDCGTLNYPIGRSKSDRKKMCVTNEHAREAVTHFEVLERLPHFTYMKFRLETGRTHQIRVHCAYIHHPVAGDPVYGPKKSVSGIDGQCLHAKKLGFLHPSTGKYMEFDSDLPDDFKFFLEKARRWK